jgi:hypothetical protein
MYVIAKPLYPLARRIWPNQLTTSEAIGRAMVNIAADGWPTQILDPRDINAAAASHAG